MTCGIVSCVFNDNGECVLKNPNTCEIMRLINRDNAEELIQYGDEDESILRCPSCDEDVTDLMDCGFNFCPYCGKRWYGK